MNKFETDFNFFTEMILSDKNFAYARYADGEVGLMKGAKISVGSQAYHVDRWQSPEYRTLVGDDLLESLNHTENDYYYAISSHTDSMDDYNFLRERIKTDNITFANLWINANYQKMKEFYTNLKKEVYLICNHKAKKQSYPFTVAEIFPFPDDCISYWIDNSEDYLNQLLDYVTQIENKTFFVSAGPVSEILIDRMYKANPKNQYIDVGSSLDEFTHGRMTRPYMDVNSQYSKEISQFYE